MDAVVVDQFASELADEYRPAHEILRHYNFYARSGPGQRMDILAAVQPFDVPAGQVLFEAGEVSRQVYFVGRGLLRVFAKGESGREISLYYVRRGECCPVNLASAKLATGAIADVEASAALHGLSIDVAAFRRLEESNQALRDTVYTVTAARLGTVVKLIREITTRRVEQRLARYLAGKFDESSETPPVVEITQKQIALDLGTAREVVSRRLQELEGAGAVRINRGRIVLQDRSILDAQVGKIMVNR
jgi:CRP/FNR family transcriptional regulator